MKNKAETADKKMIIERETIYEGQSFKPVIQAQNLN